jgi:perosamine synthetase
MRDERERFLPFYRPSLSEAEIAAVVDTLRSGWLTMGPKTQTFEQEFARFVDSPSAIAVNSATSGLHLAINALGIGPGDEVLVPTLTFAATAATVLHAGARPRLVDCEPDTLNIDVADAVRQCGPRTKAIIPVHFAGHPCEMDDIRDLARERGLSVVEDAAHALPSSYRGRPIGSLSTATVFSFYATKNLTTGEGGMITTSDAVLAERIRTRRLHGMTRDAWKRYTAEGTWRYDVAYPGFKYNMTDMNAALGLVQLQRLASFQERRRAVVDRYRAALADIEEIELPVCRPYVEHAWHLFVVRVHHDRTRIHRDQVIARLTEAGIGTSVHFIPLHEHSYYQETFRYKPSDLPNASKQWERIISLPLYPDMQDSDVDRIADALRTIFKENRR